MSELALLALTVGAFVAWSIYPEWKDRRSFTADFEPVRRLSNAAINDYNGYNLEQKRHVHLFIYHFFEELWKFYPRNKENDELITDYLFHCSDEKLRLIFRTYYELTKITVGDNPSLTSHTLLACICGCEMLRRKYSSSKVTWIVSDRTNSIQKSILSICPTPQIYIWQTRFPEAVQRSPMYPFITTTEKPNHVPDPSDPTLLNLG